MIRKHEPVRHGFTLVELMVVIAIISFLVAMLLPVLSQVRATADQTICQSNLRQIFIGSYAYAQDNQMFLPDIDTLGGYYYRQNPGAKTPTDPFAIPETYGLAALLDRRGYVAASGGLWLCNSHPDRIRAYGNTYMFQTGSRVITEPIDHLGRMAWVWDNYFALPWTTGFRARKPYGGGWSIPFYQPHRVGVLSGDAAKRATNYVYTDGSVMFENEDRPHF